MPAPGVDRSLAICVGVLLIAAVAWQSFDFARTKARWLARELRLAEVGRWMGDAFNEFPGDPSLGVIAAGGIRMTYKGVIYDLVGLNWTAMAHARHDGAGRVRGHSGFNAELFFGALPDIFNPVIAACDGTPYPTSRFLRNVTGGVTSDARFRRAYRVYCWRGMRFYVRRAFYAEHIGKQRKGAGFSH